jgi:uncharacterized repeat protein (TIGR03803 family)
MTSCKAKNQSCAVALTLAALFVPTATVIQSAEAQTYDVLYYFTGKPDGNPIGVVPAKDGVIYGTAGQSSTDCGEYSTSCGEVFEVDRTGKETVLYEFTGGNDGAAPVGSLIRDDDGNFYGTTFSGGDGPCERAGTVVGCGTVFELSPPKEKGGAWAETVLYSFQGTDGASPFAGVIRAGGKLYGTTYFGGSGNCQYSGGQKGCGVVFELNSAGKEAVLYSFTGGTDGWLPAGGLVSDPAGNLYGVTISGGVLEDCGGDGCGVVFEVTKGGRERVLYSFTGLNGDGYYPEYESLVRDSAGNLYGTTSSGGAYAFGTVFKVSPSGKETILYSFQGFLDGGYPATGLTADGSGNLYGTTPDYGKFEYYGTLFEMKMSKEFEVLYSFDQISGYSAGTALSIDSTGNLYGALSTGGNYQDYCTNDFGCGTVFKFTP